MHDPIAHATSLVYQHGSLLYINMEVSCISTWKYQHGSLLYISMEVSCISAWKSLVVYQHGSLLYINMEVSCISKWNICLLRRTLVDLDDSTALMPLVDLDNSGRHCAAQAGRPLY